MHQRFEESKDEEGKALVHLTNYFLQPCKTLDNESIGLFLILT